MSPYPVKQIFYVAITLLCLLCCLNSCTKKALKPITTTGSDTTGGDTTVVAVNSPTFYSPTGITIDASGNLYVADYGNNKIRKITPDGTVSTVAGNGTAGSINETDTLATFNEPTGVAIDAAGNLYVADSGNDLIRAITPAGVVTTLAGGDTTGSAINGTGINASFFDPVGVAADASGNVYVADAGDNLIRKVTSGGVVTTFAGNLVSGTSTASAFNNPTDVALDASGNVFVAGYLTNTIFKVTSSGAISTFAGTGAIGADNGAASAASFYYPNSVATDAAGNVYVSDGINNLIRKITPDGTVSTLAGSGTAGAIDSTGTAASFNDPAGLVVDAAGNVYVADSGNNLIRKITPAGVVTTIAGNGQPGDMNGKVTAYRNKKAPKKLASMKIKHIYKPKLNWLRIKRRS